MKNIIFANTMLLPFVLAVYFTPVLAFAYLWALYHLSRRNKRVGRIFKEYYKTILIFENNLTK